MQHTVSRASERTCRDGNCYHRSPAINPCELLSTGGRTSSDIGTKTQHGDSHYATIVSAASFIDDATDNGNAHRSHCSASHRAADSITAASNSRSDSAREHRSTNRTAATNAARARVFATGGEGRPTRCAASGKRTTA